jgi:hypothetical protein
MQNYSYFNQVEDSGGFNEDEALFWLDETQAPIKKS